MKLLITVSFLLFQATLLWPQLTLSQLRTENRANPLGLETTQPRFSWQLNSERRNTQQTAYEIRVATDERALARGRNLSWSSGKISSDQSVHIPYGGEPLRADTRYYWQVRTWDNHGRTSDWSSPAYWQMGLLRPIDWRAQWIEPAIAAVNEGDRPSPYLRKDFRLKKGIRSATAYITAHGMYEAYLNGQRIGDAYLTPGWTTYNKRLAYQAYDVTDLLTNGRNALGVALGSGWYRGQLAWEDNRNIYGDNLALLLQLQVTYRDGSSESIISDGTWTASTGPILMSEIYDGERYDARRELDGWATAGFKDKDWQAVRVVGHSKDHLVATYNEPIRKQETFAPVAVLTTPNGDRVLDFGQNLVGWVQFRARGQSGDTVRFYHAEVLDPKTGNIYLENLRAADAMATYILSGEPQTLEPHFTFFGFRYVKVAGYGEELRPEDFTAIALYSDMEPTGTFACSNPLLNQLQHNIQWGQKGNFLDVPTDCPQRDERLGWTGDAQVFARTAAYNMNVNNFFAKWLQDLAADQKENGSVPFVIPQVLGVNAAGSAGWSDAATIIPWDTYLAYGDRRVLERQYPSMKAWVQYMQDNSRNHLWNQGFHFGDWLFYSPADDRDGKAAVTDKYLIAQSFFAYSTQLLINAARVLGKTEDVDRYTELLQQVKEAYRKEYVTPNGRLVSGTQTAYVLALQFDLLPEELRAQAAERLVEDIRRYNNHLTTGFLGTPYLCHVLSRFGHTDVAYDLLLQDTYPSWLYPVKMGATTIWERWDGIRPDSTFQNPGMNSFNHYAYGAIGDWMYRNITGLDTDTEQPGYKHIHIRPRLGGGLTAAEAELQTYYGTLASAWKIIDERVEMTVIVPVNTRATLYLPAVSSAIREGTQPLAQVSSIQVGGMEADRTRLSLGSGTYRFSWPVAKLP